jgi:murein DD-endopeptidase MepM/ murein hydrolase activator NlpD
MRDFSVGQCPGGFGHQGQDIVPAHCAFEGDGAERCAPERLTLLAVHAGIVHRAQGQEGLVILVNDADKHIRFRYLHMHPNALDAAGLVSGRNVAEGDVVGKIGNYNGQEAGTSYHLHFDMQVFTSDGWILVNPYTTLLNAYERLTGARGLVLQETVAAAPAVEIPRPAVRKPAKKRPIRRKSQRKRHRR